MTSAPFESGDILPKLAPLFYAAEIVDLTNKISFRGPFRYEKKRYDPSLPFRFFFFVN